MHRMGMRYCAALLGVWVASPASGDIESRLAQLDRLVTHRITMANGLPQNSVQGITQTPDGVVWLATFGGLARLKGDTITVLDMASKPALPSNRISAVACDQRGAIWAGTDEGIVFRLTRGQPRVWEIPFRSWVTNIQFDADGVALISTRHGLYAIDDQVRGCAPTATLLPDEPVRSVSVAPDETLWIVVCDMPQRIKSSRVLRRCADRTIEIQAPRGRQWQWPCVVWSDPDCSAVIADEGALYYYRDGVCRDIPLPDPVPEKPTEIVAWPEGGLIVVYTNGIFFVDGLRESGDDCEPFVRRLPIASDKCITAFVDHRSTLWVGEDKFGVTVARTGAAGRINLPAALRGMSASCFAVDRAGRLAISMFDIPPSVVGLSDDKIILSGWRSLRTDLDGRIVGASPNRIVRLDGSAREPLATRKESDIRDIIIDRNDTIWVGAEAGLFTLENGQFRPQTLPGDAHDAITALGVDPDGVVWAGSSSALYRCSPKSPARFGRSDGVVFGETRCIAFGPNNAVYAGAYGGGILVVDQDRLRVITREDGLPENVATSILVDEARDTIWILGNRGAYRMRLSDWDVFVRASGAVPRYRIFDDREGMPEGNGGRPAGLLLDDGSVVFATIEGPRVLPSRNAEEPRTPAPRVDGVSIDGADVDCENAKVVVPANSHRVSFHISDPIWDESAPMRFSCRLVGYDSDWQEIGPGLTIAYTRLTPGDHKLELRAAIGDGDWSDTTHSFEFARAYAWHETTTVRSTAAALAVATLLTAIFAVRRRHSRRLEDMERELAMERRLQESRRLEAIGRLVGGIAHDFNNLLTVIICGGDLTAMRLPERHPAIEPLESIRLAARRAAELTGQLLTFARKKSVSLETVDLNQVLADCEKLIIRAVGDHIRVVSDYSCSRPFVKADVGLVTQILLNLATNARDAMPDGGKITIRTASFANNGKSMVRLSLSDTGCGMDDETRSRIFEPFFTTKGVGKGTGLGMATVHGIVRDLNGVISVRSERGAGTCVDIDLPLLEYRSLPVREYQAPVRKVTSPRTILLVDDNPSVRGMCTAALTGFGFRVIEAETPQSAIDVAETASERIDLFVTDVSMPGMSGPQLANAIRAVRPNTRVLYISGFAREIIPQPYSINAGDAFLQKPFTPVHLVSQVQTMFRDDTPVEV